MDDSNDDTVRQPPTVRGGINKPVVDEASAETALAAPTPAPSGSRPRVTGAPALGVSDRYKIDRVLGQGGMGEVLLAIDPVIGREVAVKRIRTDDPSEEQISRFLREAKIQGRLEHPAIVPVHDLAHDGAGKPFFVMKRLAGTDMHDTLKKLRAGDITDAAACRRKLLRAFAEVCIAVEFAHSQGIIHRDLKPANIMLGDYGEVYILDWGVAHATGLSDLPVEPEAVTADPDASPSGRKDLSLASGETQLGTILGTPAYMAPEQLVGDKVGPPADIYALGCILYEIAAEEPLHDRQRTFAQAFQVVDPNPSHKVPDSPPEIDAICERALRIEADKRWSSARAMGDAVQGYLDGDRDLVVRKDLAQHHLRLARAALERGGDEGRQQAMQAAGRALALDPESEAAELVTRLMLHPPDKVPAEVEEHLAATDLGAAREQAKLAATAMMGYLGFVPLLLWSGVHDLSILVAFAVLAIASGAQVLLLTRREELTAGPIYVNACINAALIAVVTRMVGPFIIAPTLVLTTLTAYASHPRFGRIAILATILSLSVLVPWGLELLGVLESTYRFEGGKIILSSTVVDFSAAPVQLAFALLLVSLAMVVAGLSRNLAMRQHEAARKLELQAWQLRQIVPVAKRSPP